MNICGLQKLSMVDYPGLLAATVFTGGCNLRCPFCHNALLVTRLSETPVIPEREVLGFLSSRRTLLDGVVISGGEPLLQSDIVPFMEAVRVMGFKLKLDTNGCFPDALSDILSRGLIDYIAMDIKNSREKYAQTAGRPDVDLAAIDKSIALIRGSGVAYEFRTTLTRELHDIQDIVSIGRWLEGADAYYLQNFADSGNLIGSGFSGFTPEEMQAFAAAAAPFIGKVAVRGV